MRAYLELKGIDKGVVIDCLTFTSNKSENTLNLSFSDHDVAVDNINNTVSIRSKCEETATFGLPEDITFDFGNNKESYEYIKDSTLESIVLYPFNYDKDIENIKDRISDIKLDSLRIELGEYSLEYSTGDLKNVCIEL